MRNSIPLNNVYNLLNQHETLYKKNDVSKLRSLR